MPDQVAQPEDQRVTLEIRVTFRTAARLKLSAPAMNATVGQVVDYLLTADTTLPAIPPDAINSFSQKGTCR